MNKRVDLLCKVDGYCRMVNNSSTSIWTKRDLSEKTSATGVGVAEDYAEIAENEDEDYSSPTRDYEVMKYTRRMNAIMVFCSKVSYYIG